MTKVDLAIQLRNATQAVHERLHIQPSFAALQAGSLSDAEHATLMARMGGFYTAFDAHLTCAQEVLSGALRDYSYRPRQDLFPEVTLRPVQLPEITSISAFAGAIYVVDGAVLGGQVLGRATSSKTPHPYWAWCAQHGAEVWRQARTLIAHADTGENSGAAMTTACAVFDAFEQTVAPAPGRQSA